MYSDESLKHRFQCLFALASDEVWSLFCAVAANRGGGAVLGPLACQRAVKDLFHRLYELTGEEFEENT